MFGLAFGLALSLCHCVKTSPLKMSLICMKMNHIFLWMVSIEDPFWRRGKRQLRNACPTGFSSFCNFFLPKIRGWGWRWGGFPRPLPRSAIGLGVFWAVPVSKVHVTGISDTCSELKMERGYLGNKAYRRYYPAFYPLSSLVQDIIRK